MKTIHHLTSTLLLLAASIAPVAAQSYDLSWFSIDGGGGTSSGAVFTVSGTIGQPDAGAMSGGPYTCVSGFWAGTEPPFILSAPTLQGGRMGFTFAAISGRTYTVERKLRLDDAAWTAVQTYNNSNGVVRFTHSTNANSAAFFRVRTD